MTRLARMPVRSTLQTAQMLSVDEEQCRADKAHSPVATMGKNDQVKAIHLVGMAAKDPMQFCKALNCSNPTACLVEVAAPV